MSPSEYEQLVQFLGPRFETIDRRFDANDRRFDEIYRRLERLEQKYHAITQALRHAKIEDLERRLRSAS